MKHLSGVGKIKRRYDAENDSPGPPYAPSWADMELAVMVEEVEGAINNIEEHIVDIEDYNEETRKGIRLIWKYVKRLSDLVNDTDMQSHHRSVTQTNYYNTLYNKLESQKEEENKRLEQIKTLENKVARLQGDCKRMNEKLEAMKQIL